MGYTLTEKILREHLVDGSYEPGEEIGIKIDQTLTQDATGTMAYLQFESMGLKNVATDLSVSYVDHNTIQVGFENADDHAYLQSVAAKYGLYFLPAWQWHMPPGPPREVREAWKDPPRVRQPHPHRGRPGHDRHGRWRPDVAVAMGGGAYYLTAPRVINVRLIGELQPWVTAKDVVLKVLEHLTTKGNVG